MDDWVPGTLLRYRKGFPIWSNGEYENKFYMLIKQIGIGHWRCTCYSSDSQYSCRGSITTHHVHEMEEL